MYPDLDMAHFASTTRHDGWSPDLRKLFLTTLSETGSVTVAARKVGRSRQSAYFQASRDTAFARLWEVAVAWARERRIEDAG